MKPALLLTALALLAFLWLPGTAVAQDDTARAVELITMGNHAYDSGDFRDALRKYREAYGIDDNPRLLYRIGLAYENLANYQSAREHLELYLLAEPDSPYAPRIRSKIVSLRRLEATLQAYVRVVSIPAGASVWLDTETGRPAGVTPVRIPVSPGSHEVIVRKDGHLPARQTVSVERSKTTEARFELESDARTEESAGPIGRTEPATAAAPAALEEARLIGQATRVRIGPTANINILSWVAIGVGWALVAVSAADAAIGLTRQPAIFGGGFALGAGLAAVGSYFLWIKNYTNELPPAPDSTAEVPAARFLGIGVRF